MWSIFNYIDFLLFLYFFICAIAIAIHVISSRNSHNTNLSTDKVKEYRYAIVINALYFDFQQDNCLDKLSKQDYNRSRFDLFVLKDSNVTFSIEAIIEKINNSSKDYDNVIFLDIEDSIPLDFITKMNVAYNMSAMPIQAHKIDTSNTKKETLHIAIKDEVYRQIYYNGRSSLGLASRIETNGILLNLKWLKNNRNLFQDQSQTDLYLAARGQYIVFLDKLYIDSKTNNMSERRNKSEQLEDNDKKYMSQKIRFNYFKAIKSNQIDLTIDIAIPLLMSSLMPSLRILWISITSIAIITMYIEFYLCLKWFILILILTFFIMITISDKLVTKHFDKAILKLLFNSHKK